MAPRIPATARSIAERLAEIAAHPGATADLWAYTPKQGFAEHRAAAARWIAGVGLDASPERTIITGGAHQAIVVAFAALARPGDTVLAEALTYAGICHVAERCGVRLHGLALDDEGVLPDALDAAGRTAGARLLIVNPTVHNPTTATMSLARREAIVALARRHDLIVVEDEVYGRLPAERPPPIAALAPERTVHIGSAAKSVAPGLRVGVLHSPEALFERIANAQHDLFLTCPPLMAELFTRLVADGTAERLAARQRQEAAVRQRIAREVLGARAYRAQPTSYHLWLPLPPPWRATEFIETVRERGRRDRSGDRVRRRPGARAACGAGIAQRRRRPRPAAPRPPDRGRYPGRDAAAAPRGDLGSGRRGGSHQARSATIRRVSSSACIAARSSIEQSRSATTPTALAPSTTGRCR